MTGPPLWNEAEVESFAASHVTYAALVQWLDHCEDMAGQGVTVDGYAWTDDEEGRAQQEAASRVDDRMREALTRQARRFAAAHMADLSWFEPSHAGYNLWMVRTGQGVGFRDRDLPTDRDDMFSGYGLSVRHDADRVAEFDAATLRLTEAAHAMPYAETYVVADGRIHLMTADDPTAAGLFAAHFARVRAGLAGLLRRLAR